MFLAPPTHPAAAAAAAAWPQTVLQALVDGRCQPPREE